MLDRVIQATYPPGSIYKTITASAGLEGHHITPGEKLAFCSGSYTLGNRSYACWWEYGHGRLDITNAIKQSCDVYFYDLSLRLSLEEFRTHSYNNMVLDPTGIDIPGERSGFFPNTAWYKKRMGKYAPIKGYKINLAIGQGEILVTPLAMCCYYNALARDGNWIQPYLYKRTIGVNLPELELREAELPISAETLALLQNALWEVVNEKKGTGGATRFRNIDVFGKTGSAENPFGKMTHAWFAGYAKWEQPEISFLVFVENAGHGGSIAAPIARAIIDYYDKNMRTNP